MARRVAAIGIGVAVLFGVVLAGRPAAASPLEVPSAGTAVFTGPTSPHATSIFLNPAAMGFASPGAHLYLGGSLRLDQVNIDRRLVDPTTGALSDGPGVSTATLTPGGTIALWGSVLEDKAVFGLSLSTPMVERFASGQDPLRYHVLGGYIYQSMVSAAGCFRLDPHWYFGLGFSLGYAGLKLRFERDTALEAGSGDVRGIGSDCDGARCGLENPAAAQSYEVSVSTGGLGGLFARQNLAASAGIAWEPWNGWWLTLSYVNPPGAIPSPDYDLSLSGTARVHGAPRDGGGVTTGRAEVTYRMPQTVWFGVRGALLPGWDLVTAARWENWSRQKQLDIRFFGGDLIQGGAPEWYPRYRGLRDVWSLMGGLEQEDTGSITLGGRVHVESGAVSASTVSPMQIDGFNLGAGAGVQMRLAQHLVIQASYDLTWFPTVDSKASAFDPRQELTCVDSGYDFSRCRAAREGRGIPTAAGRYSRLRHGLVLSVRYDSL